MAGMRQAGWIAVLLAGWLVGTTAALAETVPLPTPAPAPKDRSPALGPLDRNPARPDPARLKRRRRRPRLRRASPASCKRSHRLSRPRSAASPTDLPSTDPSTFDAEQRALVNRVSAYLTSVQVLTGNFVQIGPDGRRTTGHLFIQKPGKVRFEYDPPSPIDIIADGPSVVVRDRQLATQDLYPLSQTPLRFLLADHIDLLRTPMWSGSPPTTLSSPSASRRRRPSSAPIA